MKYQFLDPEVTLKMLEGVKDEITPAAKAKAEFFKKLKCPCCLEKRGIVSEVTVPDLERVRGDEIVPYGNARCLACGCLFEPHTMLVVERGNIANAIEPSGPIITPGSRD
jgi:hypothetical protein